jgi:hypothetical protein
MQHMRYDAALMRDAYLKGTADWERDKRRFEKELTHETQRNMVYLMWVRTPEHIRQRIKETDPEAYAWMAEQVEQIEEERDG